MTDQPASFKVGLPHDISSTEIDKIGAALAKAQGDMKTVLKNKTGKVKGTNKSGASYEYEYKYADLEAVREVVREVAAKNGLSLIQRPTGNILHTILLHQSGQWIDFGFYPLGESMRHQERGSAITYARRYVESCVYDIVSEEDDDGASGNENLAKQPKAEPITRSVLPPQAASPPVPPTTDGPKPPAPSIFQTKEQRDAWFNGVTSAISKAQSLTELEGIKTTYQQRMQQLKASANTNDQTILKKIIEGLDTRWEMLIPKAPGPKALNVDNAIPPHVLLDDEIPF